MGVARDGFDAIQALDAAKRCSSCRTPKRQGADWAASITRARVRGVERRQFVVLCGLCRTISERTATVVAGLPRMARRRRQLGVHVGAWLHDVAGQ